jgi:DNA repair protein RadC
LGPQALSNAELIAILLRVGWKAKCRQVGRLLQTFGGLHGLHKASFTEVCAQHGSAAKAAQLRRQSS